MNAPPLSSRDADRLRRDLTAALKARDLVAIAARRSALAAIENAEAVATGVRTSEAGHEHIAGSTTGLGAAEVERRVLTESDVQAIVEGHVDEQRSAAQLYDRQGRPQHADRLRAEADVLHEYLTRS